MDNNYIEHFANENIRYRNKIYKPNCSVKKADILSKKILKKINKDKNYNTNKLGYNCISAIFQDLFWQYSFNYIKYKNFIKKFGFNLKVRDKNDLFLFSGYKRIQDFLIIRKTLFYKLAFCLKLVFFIFWVLYKYLTGNTKKTIVHKAFFKDYRFKFGHKIKKNFLILNFLLASPFDSQLSKIDNLSTGNAIILEMERRIQFFKVWQFAFKILKPKKIILPDNLHLDYGILLAAKSLNVETIGITHGVVSKYHKFNFGYDFVNKNILKFDKLYVCHSLYKQLLLKHGHIYKNNEIFISGLLNDERYKKIKKRKIIKYILYPFEFLTDYRNINKTLKYFQDKGYSIIMKKRPDVNNYSQFQNINFTLVDEFRPQHFENALCIVGMSSSILFELTFVGIPIVLPKICGVNLYEDIKIKNWHIFENGIEKKLHKLPIIDISYEKINKNFLREFN